MTDQPLGADDTAALGRLPFHAYFLVAGADGSIDADELKGFFEGVLLMGESDDTALAAIFSLTKSSFDTFHVEIVAASKRDGADGLLASLRAGAELSKSRLPEDTAHRFLQTLYFLGKMVAEASGDGATAADGAVDHEANISSEEQAALEQLAGVLGVLV